MPRVEIKLKPVQDWEDAALEDWNCALAAFLAESGRNVRNGLRLPGYEVLEITGPGLPAEIILSASERLVVLEGLPVESSVEKEIACFVLRFAREMGAQSFFAPICSPKDQDFWQSLGALFHPDPAPLGESIRRRKVDVQSLSGSSLLVIYAGEPALCLEPIACTAHGPGPVSLAQRRLEKHFDGRALGFASRVAAHCPWELQRTQWDDLLSYSRLKAFELLAAIVLRQGQG